MGILSVFLNVYPDALEERLTQIEQRFAEIYENPANNVPLNL